MKQKFGYLASAKHAEVGTRELPELKENEVLVKQLTCNICTTDYQHWMGLREHQGYPMAGGHEGSGIVEAVGSAVTKVKVGDHVAVQYDGCGLCPACREGRITDCENKPEGRQKSADGYLGDFGFADYNIRKESVLVVMNPDLDPAEAGYLEPVATVCKGIVKLRLQPQEICVVIGAGTMGLVNAQVARAQGARVIVSEIMPKKIETAKSMGFEVIDCNKVDPVEEAKRLSGGEGVDCVIVAVGSTNANKQAVEMLKQLNGRVLLFAAGYPVPDLPFDSNLIHYRRIELIGTFGADLADFAQAAKLLNTRAIDVSKIVEPKRFPLDEYQAAMEAASTPGMYRVAVELNK